MSYLQFLIMLRSLCTVDEFSGTCAKGFLVDGHELFVVHKGGEFFAYRNSCPHLGISLEFNKDAFLDTDRRLIQCSSHGALFEIGSGLCVSGPCLGQALKPLKLELKQGHLYCEL